MERFHLMTGIIVLLLSLNISVFAHGNSNSEKIEATLYLGNNYSQGMQKLRQMEVDVAGVNIKKSLVDVLLNSRQYQALKEMGVPMQAKMQTRSAPDSNYKTSEEIQDFLRDIEKRFPTITAMVKIGQSVRGKDIWAIKISDNVSRKEIDEPAILFNSMHHAREVMTPEVAIDIIETLTSGYGKDQTITNWVNHNEIWVVPMLNVDGNDIVWNGDSMWRKNGRGDYGVDINRNYPYKWGSCNGSSGSKWSQTYRGPSAGSEPETQALMNLVANIRPVFDISFHSYSELVIYPMGCQGERAINNEVVEPIGKKLGEMLDYTPGTSWETLYSVDGGDIDWMNAEYQVIPYVLEVNSTSEGFQPPFATTRERTVKKVRVAWMYLLAQLEHNTTIGLVRNKRGNLGNKGVVEVSRYENGSYKKYTHYRLDQMGRFHLVLPRGRYLIEATHEGQVLNSKEIYVQNNGQRNYIAIE